MRLLGMSGTREWVYPQSIQGTFTRLRHWTFLGLHLALFVVPWIPVKGHPMLLLDLPHRRVHLMGAVFTPADTIFLLLLLLFLAFSLFFFTAIFGRIWCGYACPQTVFLESWIRPLEQWIEGDRTQRKRRDEGAWSFDKAWRKAAKWGVFAAVSLLLGMAMTSLFAGAKPLWTGTASATAYAFVAIFAAFWFADFLWFREQFCIYLCPYARFQSALTDDETLLISYDEARGEPRGKSRGPEGGCIGCQKCVVVCPQGIDIREGFQLECIQCARCVDACESVMSRFGQPTLVRYSSIAADRGDATRPFRPRTLVYGGLLTALTAAALVLLLGRVPFEASVNRAPGSLFTLDADGYIRNTYLLKLTNKLADAGEVAYTVEVDGLEGAEVSSPALTVGPEQSRTIPLIIRLPASAVRARSVPLTVRIASPTGSLLLPTTFATGASLGGG
ncbi:MAG TPA: cytochrome c oxidase accessory protein CcoG [Longimicrobiales bacterium]|nr:cytochrome c oxidase accessory protein CcoG [Longimicrobiales bacterium]